MKYPEYRKLPSFFIILALVLSFSASAADKTFSVTYSPSGQTANATSVVVQWYIDDVLTVTDNRPLTGTLMSQTLTVLSGQIVKVVVTFSNSTTSASAEQTITAVVNDPPALQAPTITNLIQTN